MRDRLTTCLSPRLTFFTHFTLSIHAVGGSERSERFTFPSGRLRRVKREGVTRPPGRFPSRDGRQARREKETRHGSGSCLSVTLTSVSPSVPPSVPLRERVTDERREKGTGRESGREGEEGDVRPRIHTTVSLGITPPADRKEDTTEVRR